MFIKGIKKFVRTMVFPFGYVPLKPHLVVLMTCHHHEANVRRREWALEEGNTLATWESDASLVRRLAHRAHPNPLVIEHNTHLFGSKRIHRLVMFYQEFY